jgi:O-acetyl-ADP-ribose deacetylase (regulator of RNase III)
MAKQVGDVTIDCVVGDITRQHDVEAVVNAANAELMPGGGVAGAIHRAAGAGLADECRPLAPIQPGQAVITSGHNLPNPHVIHCLGPVYGVDTPSAEKLASCYREGLRVADENGLNGVAFPALSTGAFGYPMAEAANVAMPTVVAVAPTLASVRTIRFVLTDERTCGLHEEALDAATQ